MTFGRKVPNGNLPVYSVGDAEEARQLLVLSCPRNIHGDFVATELAQHQTLDNLEQFAQRLDRMHDVLVQHGKCRCV